MGRSCSGIFAQDWNGSQRYQSLSPTDKRQSGTAKWDSRRYDFKIAFWQAYKVMGFVPRSSSFLMQNPNPQHHKDVSILPGIWETPTFTWRPKQGSSN